MPLNYSLSIHNGPIPMDIGLPENAKLGVIKIKSDAVQMDNTPAFIQFTLDQSWSMSEGDGSKMRCLKETMLNILGVIVKYEMPIWVAVDAFDTIYHKIVPITRVTQDNLVELQDKVRSIRSDGSTNLKAAIKESQKALSEATDFVKKYNFFLTDGNATIGETSNIKLCNLISYDYPTVFIGYGEDHNSQLLINGSKKHINSSYQLVMEYETVGILCGELLNEICYPALNDIVLTTSGEFDKIFNPTTNEWGHKITMGYLIAEKEYTFLINTTAAEFDVCHLSGIEPISDNIGIIELDFENCSSIDNLTANIFQHRVNEILRESVNKGRSTYLELKRLFKTIRKYARENQLLEDPAFLVMFEDIYITYTTFYETNSEMFSYSRLTANMRTQNYRSNSTQSQSHTNDFAGVSRMSSIGYHAPADYEDEPEEDMVETIIEDANMGFQERTQTSVETIKEDDQDGSDDIDSIDHYVSRTGIVDLNLTRTQIAIAREASVGVTRM